MKQWTVRFLLTALALGGGWCPAANIISWKSAVTHGYLGDAANWNWSSYQPGDSNNYFRVDLTNKTQPYLLTVTNRLEMVGAVNFRLAGTVADLTLDVSRGVLKQEDTADRIVCNGTDPFSVFADSYQPGVLYLSPAQRKESTYCLSNTVMRLSRTSAEDGAVRMKVLFDGGLVSFAEPRDRGGAANKFQSSDASTDAYRTLVFDSVRAFLPDFLPRGGTRGGLVHFKGGSAEILGAEPAYYSNSRAAGGLFEVRFSDGAQVAHPAAVSLVVGTAADGAARTNLVAVTGAGTVYSLSGVRIPRFRGLTHLHVLDGALLEFPRAPTQHRYAYFGDSANSRTHVLVSGAGSCLDCRDVVSFNFLRQSTLTVEDGGCVRFGNNVVSLGSNDAPENDVSVTLRGEGSKILFDSGCRFNLGDRIDKASRATVTVEGGFLGGSTDAAAFDIHLGYAKGATGVVSVVGGEVKGGKGKNFYVGVSGSGFLTVSGGSLVVDKTLSIGPNKSATAETSVFRQTGGFVHAGDGLLVCGASGTGEGTDRICRVVLEGGVLEASNIYGGYGASQGGTASLEADGGTLKALITRTGDYPFLYSLSAVSLGEKGLTIDTAGCNELITQDMGNKPGVEGLLVKTGAGQLIYGAGTYTVAKTQVREGVLAFREATPSFATALAVENGATLSLEGTPQTLSLAALTVAGGTLALDAGDRLVVTGPVDLDGLTLSFTAPVAAGAEQAFLVCQGRLSAASQKALQQAYCAAAHAEGYYGTVEAAYDEQTGKTTVKYVSREVSAPLTAADETVYTGADDAWATAGNWSAGVPTAEKRASFTAASAARTVTAPHGATVGALQFGVEDFSLLGESVTVAASQGAAAVAVTVGQATVAAPIEAAVPALQVPVAAGAALTLAGGVTAGGLEKTGAGRLTLAGASRYTGVLSFEGGLTTLAQTDAAKGAKSLVLKGGTLETTVAQALPPATVEGTAQTVQIFKTEADTTVGAGAIDGALIKRGSKRLTIDLTGRRSAVTLSTAGKGPGSNGLPANVSTAQTFPADGSAPASGFVGVTVAEGELVFKDDPATAVEHPVKGTMMVGMNTSQGAADPVLTIDGAKLNNYHTMGHFYVGRTVGSAASFARSATLRIINGGSLTVDTPRFGTSSEGGTSAYAVTIALTNGTLYGAYTCHWSDYNRADSPVRIRAKDSFILGSTEAVHLIGPVDAQLDGTYVGKTKTTPGTFHIQTWSTGGITGRIALRNGSVLNINKWSAINKLQKKVTVTFDDAHYTWGGGDFSLAMPEGARTDLFALEMCNRGMIVAPAAGKTLTVAWPLTGTGGFVHAGEGCVAFGTGTYAFGGVCEVEKGTVDVTGVTVAADPVFAGGGVVKGLSAAAATVRLEADDGWQPAKRLTFDGGEIGCLTIDFARTADNPLSAEALPKDLVVARFDGVAPKAVRLAGTGCQSLKGHFTLSAAGELKLSVETARGFSLIVR